jgi:hypothetical protein
MQSFTNEPFLKKRAKYAKWGSYVGFGALFVGLMTTGRNPILAYAFLLVGMLGASLGAYFAGRYVREPRADQVLKNALDGLDKRFTLYNYYLSSNHIIASHRGLTVIEPRAQDGLVTFDNGRWRHKGGFRKLLQLFGEPALGKPDQDLKRETEWVKKWIDEIMPEEDVPVSGVVVLTSSKAELQVHGEGVSVMVAADLAKYLTDGLKNQVILTTAKQKELRRTLDEAIEQETGQPLSE